MDPNIILNMKASTRIGFKKCRRFKKVPEEQKSTKNAKIVLENDQEISKK